MATSAVWPKINSVTAFPTEEGHTEGIRTGKGKEVLSAYSLQRINIVPTESDLMPWCPSSTVLYPSSLCLPLCYQIFLWTESKVLRLCRLATSWTKQDQVVPHSHPVTVHKILMEVLRAPCLSPTRWGYTGIICWQSPNLSTTIISDLRW